MEALRFALIGLGTGGLYAVVAIGLVVVYRASGVLNFSAGAIGTVSAFLFFQLRDTDHVSLAIAMLIALLVGAGTGVAIHLFVMAPLRSASALTKCIASLGVLTFLEGIALLIWGSNLKIVPPVLPTRPIFFTATLAMSEDRLILVISAVVLTLLLTAVYRFTNFGLATSAVAENRRAASSSGWSAGTIEVANWAVGGVLSTIATIFIAETVGLEVQELVVTVLLYALAAALIGSFNSFVLTLVGALCIGIFQSEFALYATNITGLSDSIPFIVIIVLIMLGGHARPTRADLPHRLPLPGSGKGTFPLVLLLTAIVVTFIWTLSVVWVSALITTLIAAFIIISVVVVLGYGGQLSLGQWAIAGIGGWIAAQFVVTLHAPFWVAAICGVILTIPCGLIVAIPALRTRGVELAIATLGLAVLVISMVLNSAPLTGGLNGLQVGSPTLFGIDFNPITNIRRYAMLCFVLLIFVGFLVSNLRRGSSGRRLLAVRSNERAAAALGIGVYATKMYAFGVAAGIAAIGGILTTFRQPVAVFDQFDIYSGIYFVMYAVIGGVGFLSGTLVGVGLVAGGFFAYFFQILLGQGVNAWLIPIGGAIVVFNLKVDPDGIAAMHEKKLSAQLARLQAGWESLIRSLVPTKVRARREAREARRAADVVQAPRPPASLQITDLSVRYGGLVALNRVSFSADPGEVLGLIGPNGAGKTTLLDAVTGFTRPSGGRIVVGTKDITGLSPVKAARAGISCSFQSVLLFDSMSVRENLLAAAEENDRLSFLTDLVHPKKPVALGRFNQIVDEFGLHDVLDAMPSTLPHGTARLVGVARAVLSDPAVLLLDEPAAGLDAKERSELGPLIRRIARERHTTVVLIEHDVSLVLETCDRVVVLNFGQQIAEGLPDEIRTNQKVIDAYLGSETEYGPSTASLGAAR